MDKTAAAFAFHALKPNVSPTDLCGEGLCRNVKVYDGILIHERHRLGWLWYLQISLEVYSDLQSIFFWLCLDVFGEPLWQGRLW